MGDNIYNKLKKAKNGDKYYLEEIIKLFNPLISKYSRLLDGEDTKQDLSLHLIKTIDKISINKECFFEDKFIVSYISKSIRNEYIRLSKVKYKKILNEVQLNTEIEIGYENFVSEIEFLDIFKVLTENESYIMKLIYIYYLSVSEVANHMKISRQAVNQAKNRALLKIKNVYMT